MPVLRTRGCPGAWRSPCRAASGRPSRCRAATPCPAWQQQCALGRAPACLQRLLVYVHRLRLTSLPDPSRVAACMRGLVEAARQPEE